MKVVVVVAVLALVAIGAVEASVSAQQLSESSSAPRLRGEGVLLSAAGLLASMLVYLALGALAQGERRALRTGAVVGILAGAVGGTLRALVIRDALESIVARYAVVPEWFVPATLAVFVLLACAVSAAGGGALAWTGRRLSRAARTRPPA